MVWTNLFFLTVVGIHGQLIGDVDSPQTFDLVDVSESLVAGSSRQPRVVPSHVGVVEHHSLQAQCKPDLVGSDSEKTTRFGQRSTSKSYMLYLNNYTMYLYIKVRVYSSPKKGG